MRSGWRAGLAVAVLTLAGCTATPAPASSSLTSSPSAGPCTGDLPPRTSPTDFPVAVLHVAGDDVPPVVGDVEWLGGASDVVHQPARPVHQERFTVLQSQGQAEVQLRMSDDVRIAAWTIDAVPDGQFRSGDLESDRVRWSEGDDPTDLVCIPVQDGRWAVIAEVTFADDAGGGTYYWRLNLSQTPGT